ncbi:ribosomal protein S5 domain 2-type protein [Pyronema domesticum]|uniref:Similar to Protein IMPACT homolog acc. no. O13997 n=1 Tax=Pyronema omphalodes (strain CBS 100304) TaxID=1076935 RepID=U4L9T8_PYROM|nr:ribosomal protein S5 domain 2-type protein [Pyronema domesticum]CCX15943.1 Similar to Protein IMPACT homolog; acc. no. O13997 [Pyronema omphalodes CBS 100304]
MNDDLADEIEALNAIYDSECLVPPSSSEAEVYILQPPTSVVYPQLTLRLRIPQTYPQQPPTILDAGSVGAALADEVLKNVWREGEVCLYDLVEGLREVLGGEPEPEPELPRQATPPPPPREPTPPPAVTVDLTPRPSSPDLSSDPWIIAPPVVEKKSTFVARVIEVTDAKEAQRLINTCLADKKLAKATHNISAYRIVRENGSTIQDNDDDGETAAGSRLAHLLQVMDVQNVLVVVSRWYGGVKLGPDRFRLINTAAREALVLGGFVKEEKKSTKGKGKK